VKAQKTVVAVSAKLLVNQLARLAVVSQINNVKTLTRAKKASNEMPPFGWLFY
jgi:hypothetical protein